MLRIDDNRKPVHVNPVLPHTVPVPSKRETIVALKKLVELHPERADLLDVLFRFVATR